MLTDDRLNEIKARHAAASPGPWDYVGDVIVGVACSCECPQDPALLPLAGRGLVVVADRPHEAHDVVPAHAEVDLPDTVVSFGQYRANCRYIAHSWQDMADLLAEVRDLQTNYVGAVRANRTLIKGQNEVLQTHNVLALDQHEENKRLRDEVTRLRSDFRKADREIEQILGKALGYPYMGPEVGGDYTEVCVGENVPASLADEAAERLGRFRVALEKIVALAQDDKTMLVRQKVYRVALAAVGGDDPPNPSADARRAEGGRFPCDPAT